MENKNESQSRRKRKGTRRRKNWRGRGGRGRGRGRGSNSNWLMRPEEDLSRPDSAPVEMNMNTPFPQVEGETDFMQQPSNSFGRFLTSDEKTVKSSFDNERRGGHDPMSYGENYHNRKGSNDVNSFRDYPSRGRGGRRVHRRRGRGRRRQSLNAQADPFIPNRRFPSNQEDRSQTRSTKRNKRGRGRNEHNSKRERESRNFNRNRGRGNFSPQQNSEEEQEEVMILPEGPGSEQMKTMIWELKLSRYKCAVCHNIVKRRDSIWSCSTCYTLYHLHCIETWAKKSKETKDIFACPNCNYVHVDFKAEYQCFCGKEKNPEYSNYLTPHSCGNKCGRVASESCTHPCSLDCHPGRCEPCDELGDFRACSCGKKKYQLKCGQVEERPQSCGNTCGRILNCSKHTCNKICGEHDHVCEIKEEQTCFCGAVTEMRPCGTGVLPKRVDPTVSTGSPTTNEETTPLEPTVETTDCKKNSDLSNSKKKSKLRFQCENPCSKPLDCGNHQCTRLCGHEGKCSECVRKRTFPIKCACGQTTVKRFRYRSSCLDPLPTCDNVCGKMLGCNKHLCQEKCHDSPCPPCQERVVLKCRCKDQKKKLICSEASEQKSFLCKRKCPKVLSCGVHRCNVVCCEGRTTTPWPEHTCVRFCGKKLRCGRHECPNHCHGKRECNTCEIVLRGGVFCACGKTSIDQPILCPFAPPNLGCTHPCSRTRDCGHPCLLKCHDGPCPPCTVLMTKYCDKHRTPLTNIHCHVEVCCGKKCGNLMRCGLHFCEKFCHKGKCFDERLTKYSSYERSCGYECGKKLSCGHRCKSVCHGPGKCPETECKQTGVRRCYCGHLEKQGPCMKVRKLKKMPCTEACKVEQRNRNLREAWGLT